jgi:hypothetical protein
MIQPNTAEGWEEVRSEAVRKLRAELQPGEGFLISFIVVKAASVSARFGTAGAVVTPATIAHPRSDLAVKDGNLQVNCPGISAHPLRVSKAAWPVPEATMELRSQEPGLGAFLFQNSGTRTDEVEVELHPVGASIVLVSVEVIPPQLTVSLLAASGEPDD